MWSFSTRKTVGLELNLNFISSALKRHPTILTDQYTYHFSGYLWKTYVFMIHTLHEDQLPVSSLGMSLVLKRSAELLNGHVSVKDGIICSTAVITNTGVTHLREYLALLMANS